ncbi:MAG: c-type cytochrome [Pseudomonadales bacterium]
MFRSLSFAVLLCGLGACGQPSIDAGSSDSLDVSKSTANEYVGDRVGHFGFGQPASTEQIAGWDIDIRPDGQGLPVGSGSVAAGEMLYEDQCAECHGSFGEGVGRHPVIAGGMDSLTEDRPNKTVGSFWPYTSTLYDYIYRAMPFTQPESLTADETYAITAYVLYLNDLVEDEFVLDQNNLASIRLPNESNFVPDPRPDVANTRCMSDCRDPSAIKILSEVTPSETDGAELSAAAVVETTHPGQATYDQYCSICHKVGVSGAPIYGDSAAWSKRLEAGLDVVIANSINGVSSDTGVMPAKGGFSHLTDEQVQQAVEYMVGESS